MPNPQIIDAGRIRPVFRGAWSLAATYSFFDVVTAQSNFSGGDSSYIYMSQVSGSHIAPNSSDAANPWILLAAGGADGDQGDPGTTPDISALQYTVENAVSSGQLDGFKYVSGAVDFDTFTTYGDRIYVADDSASHTHAPEQAKLADGKYARGFLLVLGGKNADVFAQLYIVWNRSYFTVCYRMYSSGTFSGWRTLMGAVNFVSTTGLNLNNFYRSGLYGFTTTAVSNGSNFPVAMSGCMDVIGNDGGQVYQIYLDYNARAYLRRGGSSGTYNDWRSFTPPYAQTTTGIGQFVSFDVAAGNACKLPAGGTWEYDVFAVNSSGNIVGHAADVKAGGSTIFSADSGKSYYGHCKRVY